MDFESPLGIILGIGFLAVAFIFYFVLVGGSEGDGIKSTMEDSKEAFMCSISKQMLAREGPEAESCNHEEECDAGCNDRYPNNGCVCKEYSIIKGEEPDCISHKADINPNTLRHKLNVEAYCK